ncbi:MAG: PorT family protein [Bacteroidales bacterium]|nr:PorT family protein [Bacteroidales bacterium]
MSANFENIDSEFRRELRDYSQPVPSDVWGNIEKGLNQSKKSKFASFYKIAAAIMSFALIGSLYFYINSNNDLETDPVIADSQQPVKTDSQSQTIDNNLIISEPESNLSENISKTSKNEDDLLITETPLITQTKNQLTYLVADVNTIRINDNLSKIESYPIIINVDKPKGEIIDVRKERIKELLNSISDLNNVIALNIFSDQVEQKSDKWAFGGEFSPLYSYRHITETVKESDKEYFNNVENPVMTYSGGLNMQYKAYGRLTVQLGVYYSTMGQSLDYMSVYANSVFSAVADEYKDRYLNSWSLENSTGGISFNSEYVFIDDRAERVVNLAGTKNTPDITNPVFSDLDAEVRQNFQYVEVPFLLRYKLVDKLIDVNLVGGFGANFLIGNNVFLVYGDTRETIGHTEGVNDINYNGTIGLGFEYPLMKRINIRFEPTVKYYLNEINPGSPVESHPYSLGIYTGINYSF